MATKRPHNLCKAYQNDDKQYYQQVGIAWISDDGIISIKLPPGILVSGELVAFPPRESDEGKGKGKGKGKNNDDMAF